MKVLLFFTLLSLNVHADFLPQQIITPSADLIKSREIPLEFKKIQAEIHDLFLDDIKNQNGELIVNYDHGNPTANASASREGNLWFIKFNGGLIFHKKFDSDLYIAILCHELGHHLGGTPFKFPQSRRHGWVAAEGQSDYFASNICFKRYFLNQDNESYLAGKKIEHEIQEGCKQNHPTKLDYQICVRGALIAKKVGKFLRDIGRTRRGHREPIPTIGTPDQTIVHSTVVTHPLTQCRLDTYFQGALCNLYDGRKEENLNCKRGHEVYSGSRPRCWFHAEN